MKFLRTYGLIAVLALGGCASKSSHVANVFDDLVNETNQSNTFIFDYRSFLSISGLTPVRAPGMLVIHPASISPTHAVGISPKRSYLVRSKYKLEKDAAKKLEGLGNKYRQLLLLAHEVAELGIVTGAASNAVKSAGDGISTVACQILAIETAACSKEKISETLKVANERLKSAQERFNAERQAFERDSNVRNSIVMRWEKRDQAQAGSSYGGLAKASYEGESGRTGIAIYGDFLIETLYIGEDFIDMIRSYDTAAEKWIFTRSSIPTYVVSVKHIEYISDADSRTSAGIDIAISQSRLKAIREALGAQTDATELKASIAFGLVGDLGNRGYLSDPETDYQPFCFFPPQKYQEKVQQHLKDLNGYSTIYAVEPQLQYFTSVLVKWPETDLSWLAKPPNTDEQLAQALRQYEDQCDRGTIWRSWDARFINRTRDDIRRP